ncbi:iron only nitrogenase protein AnfO [Clostridium homopropionicum DSM 5847]|uniref:Iron only nitrogenase protein AnfO n=1 Tax=Clostridium homopropionicum DSM 5847 TaxID=1121318 RepID=A0A0L6Z6N6_9CLOT|nr:Fe-only nitrogenase accessory protein AnfO [Clostridium homopropionicum]KOA18621.1 iron only nitrogenase protein AnfO [Clostridium homopropionicum DSM 5847]SFG50363.1 Fe-only nitrogenase accessory protein AnfO [Clostridium homopropionicum]
MEIAVFLNYKGETTTFNENGIVRVYLKDDTEWKVIKEIPFGINHLKSLKEIREAIRKMADNLNKCRVFVAAEMIGIPYTIFESMGFNLWKIEGVPSEFLDHVLENEEQERINNLNKNNKTVPMPVKNDENGNYHIDLKIILESNEMVTSKQILLPFLHKTKFNELQIRCGHVPKWFEGEFKKLGFRWEIENINKNELNIKVYSNY